MDEHSDGDETSLREGMGYHWHHPENKFFFSQETCMGSGRPSTRRSRTVDQEHLQMGRSGEGWYKRESGVLQSEKC